MYIQQSDLFRGMSRDFLAKVMEITTKETHEAGDILFEAGDEASYSYVLLSGRVRIAIRETGYIVFVADEGGGPFPSACRSLERKSLPTPPAHLFRL